MAWARVSGLVPVRRSFFSLRLLLIFHGSPLQRSQAFPALISTCSFLYLTILTSSSLAGPRYLRGSNSPGFSANTFRSWRSSPGGRRCRFDLADRAGGARNCSSEMPTALSILPPYLLILPRSQAAPTTRRAARWESRDALLHLVQDVEAERRRLFAGLHLELERAVGGADGDGQAVDPRSA